MATPDGDPELEPGLAVEAVQADEYEHFDVQRTRDLLLRSTGAIFGPMRHMGAPVLNDLGEPLRTTCGVTFVSPRYAITAAHCVPNFSATENLTVEQYDVSTLSGTALAASQQVSGWFPDYTRPTLTAADGYHVQRYEQCRVVSRCSYGTIACDTIADIALVRCADRPAGSDHISVAHRDDERSAVDMQWFHELLAMPTQDPGSPPLLCWTPACVAARQQADRWAHYGALYYGGEPENFHYHPRNQLLPLRQSRWQWGDIWRPRMRLPSPGSNLLRDGDFEASTTGAFPPSWWFEGGGWAGVDVGAGLEHEGRNNGWIYKTDGSTSQVVQRVSVVPNARYRLSAWIRNSNNGLWADIGARDVTTKLDLAYRWTWDQPFYQRIAVEFEAGARTEVEVYIQLLGNAGVTQWVQFDEVRLHRVDFSWEASHVYNDSTVAWTDLYGCHGTSGSGIVQWNAGVPELLGPVTYGSPGAEFAHRLCIDGDETYPGDKLLSYTRTEYSRMMETIAWSDELEWW